MPIKTRVHRISFKLIASAWIATCTAGCAANTQVVGMSHAPTSALEALLEADRLNQWGRVVLQDSVSAEGRVISLGQQRFRVGATRFDSSQLVSLTVRKQSGVGGRSVLAGAAIGALGTMFLAIGVTYAGLPLTSGSSDATLLGGGAVVGGLLGAIIAAAAADETWERRWPD